MGIYVGPNAISPLISTTRIIDGQPVPIRVNPTGVYVGPEMVWPQAYREAFYWFDADTPGRATHNSGKWWEWQFHRPEWATNYDVILVRTGGRGFDGARGFGNNDGNGGRAWTISQNSSPVRQESRAYAVRIGIPGTSGDNQIDRSPHPTQIVAWTGPNSIVASPPSSTQGGEMVPSSPTGVSVPPRTVFGRTWPGGSGGARDQPGQPYGGGGGGGQGAPLIGDDRRNGQNGAPGYVAIRFRSGAVPDGHVWPENPGWANLN